VCHQPPNEARPPPIRAAVGHETKPHPLRVMRLAGRMRSVSCDPPGSSMGTLSQDLTA
jgi:hypothetical protein